MTQSGPKKVEPMSITAVIPLFNGLELLRRLFPTLEAQTQPAAGILVVNNGSTDGAPEFARARGARVIAMGRNAGFAPAVNRGIRESHGEWIAVLNSDVELAPDYFATLLAAAEAENAWFATGRLMAGRCGEDASAWQGPMDGAYDLVCRGGSAWRAASGRAFGPPFDKRRKIWSAPWTAALFRAELFERVGLLEESFESYLEDADFGLRCARLGLAGVYEPAAVAWHVGSATGGRWSADTVRLIARNRTWLVARHFPEALLTRNRWPIFCAHVLWGALALRHGAPLAWLRGVREGRLGAAAARAGRLPWDERALENLLAENERAIRVAQRITGFDWYWKMYFFLTPGGAK